LLELARRSGVEIVYDIGANIGTWSLLSKSIIPDADVHAFEPLPKHHEGFVGNVAGIEKVTLHRVALGPKNTSAILHVTNFSDASSMLSPAPASRSHFGVAQVEQFCTQVWRLDDYRATQLLPWPHLLKLDVQGFELEVLKGAQQCLCSAKAVIAEVSFVEFYEGQCLFHELVGHLAEAGLLVQAFGFNTPVGRSIEQTDVLFMRPLTKGRDTPAQTTGH
jgi:FkbM family methyltransferase